MGYAGIKLKGLNMGSAERTSVLKEFAQCAHRKFGSEIIMIKGVFPSLPWLQGELVFILVKGKEFEIREKIFKLISEISGQEKHSLAPLLYSAFEFKENRSMKSHFTAWLCAEGEVF